MSALVSLDLARHRHRRDAATPVPGQPHAGPAVVLPWRGTAPTPPVDAPEPCQDDASPEPLAPESVPAWRQNPYLAVVGFAAALILVARVSGWMG